MTKVSNISVGRATTSPSTPSHMPGVRQGNRVGNFEKEAGFVRKGGATRATARRSTGINPDDREPIDPSMPHLTPA